MYPEEVQTLATLKPTSRIKSPNGCCGELHRVSMTSPRSSLRLHSEMEFADEKSYNEEKTRDRESALHDDEKKEFQTFLKDLDE
jgi:hypothetical protein